MVEQHLRRMARAELHDRAWELARLQGVHIRAVQIRAQISRWGSCSSTGTVSLNWRLIQTPNDVRDYIIIHELIPRRELNHSPRYWAHVAKACPHYDISERWLKQHGREIL